MKSFKLDLDSSGFNSLAFSRNKIVLSFKKDWRQIRYFSDSLQPEES
jgi:hypothetical protein